jgi:chromate transporter
MDQDKKSLWKLFASTFYLSAFTFGGGYVIVPLMKKRFVDKLGWIEEEEMLNLIAIAQSSPGPIAVNTSILLGYKVFGVAGSIMSVLGTVLPPLIILTAISYFYQSFKDNRVVRAVLMGMQAGVAAVIMDVIISMVGNVIKSRKLFSILMMGGALIAALVFDINVVLIILVCGLIGAIAVLYGDRKGKGAKKQ